MSKNICHRDKIIRECFRHQIETILNEKQKKEKFQKGITPTVGARTKFMHYINDLKMTPSQAIQKIRSEFPEISKDDIIEWFREAKDKAGKGGWIVDCTR